METNYQRMIIQTKGTEQNYHIGYRVTMNGIDIHAAKSDYVVKSGFFGIDKKELSKYLEAHDNVGIGDLSKNTIRWAKEKFDLPLSREIEIPLENIVQKSKIGDVRIFKE